MLQIGNGGTNGSLAGNLRVDDGGQLEFNLSTGATYTGTLTAEDNGDALRNDAAGTTITLDGTQGTQTGAGRLAIRASQSATSNSGNAHDYELEIGGAGNGVISGIVADGGTTAAAIGKGSLIKEGTGTWVLTNAHNSYRGGTSLNDGTLELASLTAAGAGQITFGDGAQTLRLDANGTLANKIDAFDEGDVIDLTGITRSNLTALTTNTVNGVTTLFVSDPTGTVTLTATAAPDGFNYALGTDANGKATIFLQALPGGDDGGGADDGGGGGDDPTAGDDNLTGTDGPDKISLGLGNDTYDGGAGNDLIYGNQGNDLITGSEGQDTAFGGQGDDTVDYADSDDPTLIYGNLGNDSLAGGSGNDSIFGGQGDDTVSGGQGADLVYGNQGNDLIYGNQGDDKVYGGQGDDVAYGGQGNDFVYGNLGNDAIYGNLGNDVLYGGQGDDKVFGGQGADVLFGNKGNDLLVGGLGNDTFGFNPGDTGFQSGIGTGDIVQDFVSGQDKVDFTGGPSGSAANFGAGTSSSRSFAAIQAAAQALIDAGKTYAFITDGVDGYLFTTGGNGTTIADAVELAGAATAGALTFQDIVGGPVPGA